MKTNLKNCS